MNTMGLLGLTPKYLREKKNFIRNLLKEDLSFIMKRKAIQDNVSEECVERLRIEFLMFIAIKQQYSRTLIPSMDVDVF
ncbi:MAG: hypothetical protein ACI9BF_000294 [Candidatus Paceibacteria bacterium]|jgi:hypothetical protein